MWTAGAGAAGSGQARAVWMCTSAARQHPLRQASRAQRHRSRRTGPSPARRPNRCCTAAAPSLTCEALSLRQVNILGANHPEAHAGVLDDAVVHAAQAVGDEDLAGGPAGGGWCGGESEQRVELHKSNCLGLLAGPSLLHQRQSRWPGEDGQEWSSRRSRLEQEMQHVPLQPAHSLGPTALLRRRRGHQRRRCIHVRKREEPGRVRSRACKLADATSLSAGSRLGR